MVQKNTKVESRAVVDLLRRVGSRKGISASLNDGLSDVRRPVFVPTTAEIRNLEKISKIGSVDGSAARANPRNALPASAVDPLRGEGADVGAASICCRTRVVRYLEKLDAA